MALTQKCALLRTMSRRGTFGHNRRQPLIFQRFLDKSAKNLAQKPQKTKQKNNQTNPLESVAAMARPAQIAQHDAGVWDYRTFIPLGAKAAAGRNQKIQKSHDS
ncbi:MAG: hypothetical protein AABZ47_18045 [Planctomycetota bacterium]